VHVTGGELAVSGKNMTFGEGSNTNGEANLIIQGDAASIHIDGGRDLICNKGNAHITYILNGNPAGITPIVCDYAALNSTNATIEWQLGDNFRGTKGTEYTLIQANSIATNGCNFVDSTEGGSFELKQDGGRLYLLQTDNWPHTGTLISIR
jgi:hypothetical protein